jgi:RNA polymerase sigma factor (TIGR02999 family)
VALTMAEGARSPDLEMTRLIRLAADGNQDARDRLYNEVYEELRRLARAQRRRWEGDYTLGTSALVHEAFLRLDRGDDRTWSDRHHFFAVASRAMRQILLDYAKERTALKRGGGADVVSLADTEVMSPEVAEEVLALHEALERLAAIDERSARVVELRFFGGLTLEQTAETLETSVATVRRDWAWARVWLRRELAFDPVRTDDADDGPV